MIMPSYRACPMPCPRFRRIFGRIDSCGVVRDVWRCRYDPSPSSAYVHQSVPLSWVVIFRERCHLGACWSPLYCHLRNSCLSHISQYSLQLPRYHGFLKRYLESVLLLVSCGDFKKKSNSSQGPCEMAPGGLGRESER